MRSNPPSCVQRSGRRFNAPLPVSWVMLLFLLTLSAGCSHQPVQVHQYSLPPANLTAPCPEGPLRPEGDVPLHVVITVVAAREKAAEVCRTRHGELVRWIDSQLK